MMLKCSIRNTRRIVLLMFTLLILTACESTTEVDEEGKESSEDVLYIGMTNAPDSFNPFNAPGAAGKWIQRFIYDSLLTQPEALQFEAGLADSFETQDNQNYTIHLNPEAFWTDGEAITADDVVFTLNTIANPDVETTLGVNVSMLEGVEDSGKLPQGETEIPDLIAVDDQTVTFKTKTPVDPNYVSEMIGFNILIVPEHIVSEIEPEEITNSEFATNPTVSSGPYQFVEYQNDAHVELTSNPDYYKGIPEIESIFVRIMNGTSLVTEFASGGIQMNAGGNIGIVPIQDIETLRSNESLLVEGYSDYVVQLLMINNESYTDPAFRQALSYAINKEQIVDELIKGEGEALGSSYTSASPYKSDEVNPLSYDPKRAEQLITESTIDSTQEINLVVPTGNTVREQSANLIEQNLEAVGLNVVQTTYDAPTALDAAKQGEYDLLLMGFTFNVDPDISNYYASGGASNYGRINSPELDELLQEGKTLTSFDERFEVYEDVQELMQEEMFIVPLYSSNQIIVKSTELKGGMKEFWAGSLSDVHEWTLEKTEQ